MHPLTGDLRGLTNADLDTKINDLTKKYFMTPNPGVKAQMAALLEDFKIERSRREQAALEKMMANRDKSLDKLINVS
jgi:hypothetical protein